MTDDINQQHTVRNIITTPSILYRNTDNSITTATILLITNYLTAPVVQHNTSQHMVQYKNREDIF
jgi:hypothetical protein